MAEQLNEDVPKGTIAKFIYENRIDPKNLVVLLEMITFAPDDASI
jgi:hypothetical protein